MRQSRAASIGATLVAVVTAAVLVAVARGGSVDGAGSGQPLPVAVTPPVLQKPVPAPPRQVGASGPTSFTLVGKAFAVNASMCAMDGIFPLDPPGDQFHTVCWVKNVFGHAPASKSAGTTYVLGHAWAEAPLVLNPMATFAMDHVAATPTRESGVNIWTVDALNGYRIILRTPKGTLTYEVRRAFTIAKLDLPQLHSVWENQIPNRVVLITCAVHNGVDIERNVIAYAYLIGAKPA